VLNEIAKLRLKDFEILEEVSRSKSIREVARRMRSTPGQISKSIQNIEKVLGTKLFKRSVSGVLLTGEGAEIQKTVQEILAGAERIEKVLSGQENAKLNRILAIAGTAFINTHFTTPVVCRASDLWPTTTFRFLDLAPDQMVATGMRGGFDLAVYHSALSWPSSWFTKKIGKSRWMLCARASHPLSKRPSLKQVLEYPFVVPAYWTSEGLLRGNDHFPVPISKRRTGFETATADAAIPILMETNQLAFLPEILVKTAIESGKIKVLRVNDLPVVQRDLFLSAKADSVPANLFEHLRANMAKALSQ
jgi:DNA-binding transcriptional LysR family regulator